MSADKLNADEARQKIHKTVRSNIPFEEKTHKALELGKQYLGVENGYLTRIDEETDHWEIVVTSDTTDSQVPPGFELDLQETYCRKTITDESPLALHDAPNQGWAEDPAVETSGQQTYLGIPLITDEEPYGTVCFVAEDAQSDSFSEAETHFADHLTRLLERELEKEYIKDDLTNQTNLATVLNRVLRHNLRNDISVIRGYTKVMTEQLDDDHAAKTALDHIDDLIDLTQKARELEEVITTSSERQATEIGTLIKDIAAGIRQDYPAASIDVEYDYDIKGRVLQNFDRAIIELIENAVKHSVDDPRVTVTIDTVPNAIEIGIRDNGPGLPDHEAAVLTSGEETPLAHGSGLGLWLAYWIVTSHDGSIDPEVTQYGTKINITIPRKPAATAQEQLTEVTRSRDKYKTAFEESSDAITMINDDGRIIDANEAASTIFGVETTELLGRSLTEFLPDDFAFEAEWQGFQNVGNDRDTATVIGADGVERIIEYSGTADIIPGQHLLVSRDVTERRERERELEVAETVFQNTQDALVLVDVVDEQEYHLNRVNDAFLTVTPHSRENISGMTPREMLGDGVGGDIQSQFTECVRTQQRVEFEQVVPAEDGRRIWQVQVTPVMQDDEVTRLVLVMRNITERRERKLELQTTTQRLQLALEGTDTGVWGWELGTENVRWSESLERLVGIEPGTFKGTFDAFAEYVHPDDRQQVINAVEQAVETGRRFQTEYRLQRANGSQIWVEARGEVHDDGETNRMVGIVTDISDRKG